MKKKIYQFRLSEVQYLATHHAAFGDTWMEGQKLPVYALIADCSASTSSYNVGPQPYTNELECPNNDITELNQ